MESSAPDSMPQGMRPPPTPPKSTAVGFNDEGDKRRITVTRSAEGEGKFIRKSDARGQYGHVTVHIEPNGRGKGVVILREVNEGTIPGKFVEAITYGIRTGLDSGVDHGPVVDVVIRISGGSWNAEHSSDLAFKMAGIFAINDAVKNAGPVSLDE